MFQTTEVRIIDALLYLVFPLLPSLFCFLFALSWQGLLALFFKKEKEDLRDLQRRAWKILDTPWINFPLSSNWGLEQQKSLKHSSQMQPYQSFRLCFIDKLLVMYPGSPPQNCSSDPRDSNWTFIYTLQSMFRYLRKIKKNSTQKGAIWANSLPHFFKLSAQNKINFHICTWELRILQWNRTFSYQICPIPCLLCPHRRGW